MYRVLLIILFIYHHTNASFCGTGTIPYSFEVSDAGLPILGCARPSCFRGHADRFANINRVKFQLTPDGKADGFLREEDDSRRWFRTNGSAHERAICTDYVSDVGCRQPNTWVGGIETITDPRASLQLHCCFYDGLRLSQAYNETLNVRVGEIFIGGEVYRHNRQFAFDYIANVEKRIDTNDSLPIYSIYVRRLPCVPDPNESIVAVDNGVTDYLYRLFNATAGNISSTNVIEMKTNTKLTNNIIEETITSKEIDELYNDDDEEKLTTMENDRNSTTTTFIDNQQQNVSMMSTISVTTDSPVNKTTINDNFDDNGAPRRAPKIRSKSDDQTTEDNDQWHKWQQEESIASVVEQVQPDAIVVVRENAQTDEHVTQSLKTSNRRPKPQQVQPILSTIQQQQQQLLNPFGLPNIFTNPVVQQAPTFVADGNNEQVLPNLVEEPFDAEQQEVEIVDAIEGEELFEAEQQQQFIQPPAPQSPLQLAYPFQQPQSSGDYFPSFDAFTGFACFTDDTLVRTNDGGMKRMDELQIGDMVLSANNVNQPIYSPIESFLHRIPNRTVEFHRIHTDSNHTLSLTGEHFIYSSNCRLSSTMIKLVSAKSVRAGECIYRVSSDGSSFIKSRVLSNVRIQSIGAYAPMTANAMIVVNDVLASCHSVVNSVPLQQTFVRIAQYVDKYIRLLFAKDNTDQTQLPIVFDYLLPIIEYVLPKYIIES